MYMKLLEETIRELKGEDLEDDVRATVNLRIDFRIEESYVPDMNQRLMIYRRIAGARREEELSRIMEEMRDRYGPPPVPVLNLADYGRIRVLADQLGIETIEREGTVVAIRFREKAKVDPMRVVHLVRSRQDLQLIPPVTLKMDLKKAPEETSRGRAGPTPRAPLRRQRVEAAWWTARATTGTVEAGFSKAEILRPKEEDPRAPGGILQRVTALLEDLADA